MSRQLLVPLALLIATPAFAQVSGSVSVLSDYRYRGASLSDGRPAVQGQAGYDFANGVYGGALVSSVRVDDAGDGSEAMVVAYLGRTMPLRRGWHWDAGVQYAAFTRSREYDHGQLYAGIGTRDAGIRLHYSDAYFGGGPAWYAEWDGRRALSERWHLVVHAGTTWIDEGREAQHLYDWTLGVGMTLGDHEVQVLWSGADGSLHYRPVPGYGEHDGLALKWTRSW